MSTTAPDSNTFVFEEVELDEDDDMEYKEVSDIDTDDSDDGEEEDFTAVFKTLRTQELGPTVSLPPISAKKSELPRPPRAVTIQKPVVVDDFIRNFLIKTGMKKSLDVFQAEWYEMKTSGQLPEENTVVPDLYVKNEQLDNQLYQLREDANRAKKVAEKARGTWEKFRRERDFHRMHHRRVQQEKDKLIKDIKRLQTHQNSFEPAMKSYKLKYEATLKENMLVTLEKDRLKLRLESLELQMGIAQGETKESPSKTSMLSPKREKLSRKAATQLIGTHMAQSKPDKPKRKSSARSSAKSRGSSSARRKGQPSEIPPEGKSNPHAQKKYSIAAGHKFTMRKTFKGHQAAISCLALHPKKPVVATGSDDCSWKLWSLPKGELLMSGEGHDDWIGDVAFNPREQSILASCSGDGTVKVWNLAETRCTATLKDHSQAVWSCDWHWNGDFLVTGSLDQSIRMWDINTSKTRQTFRGHVDSVNKALFVPYSNAVVSASADKTLSLWDIRTGNCVHIFGVTNGHENAIMDAAFQMQGDCFASSDSNGVVKVWDMRTMSERLQIQTSQEQNRHPVNSVAFDPSGKTIVVGTNDSMIKFYSVEDEGAPIGEHEGHTDSVQACLYDRQGRYMVSAASDSTFRFWA